MRRFLSITIPLLTPLIFFNLVLQMIFGFTVFTAPFIISGGSGAPLDSVLLYSLYLYQKGFKDFQMGYAAAMAWALLLVVACFTHPDFSARRRAGCTTKPTSGGKREYRQPRAPGRVQLEPRCTTRPSSPSASSCSIRCCGWSPASFKPADEIFTNVTSLIPRQFTLDNYVQGWAGFGGIPFVTFFRNSLVYSVVAHDPGGCLQRAHRVWLRPPALRGPQRSGSS